MLSDTLHIPFLLIKNKQTHMMNDDDLSYKVALLFVPDRLCKMSRNSQVILEKYFFNKIFSMDSV